MASRGIFTTKKKPGFFKEVGLLELLASWVVL
jgi:hypothetical protein